MLLLRGAAAPEVDEMPVQIMARTVAEARCQTEDSLEGMLEPVIEERILGQAEVRQTFTISKVGTVAGCMVLEGKVERNALARVKRNGAVVFEGGKITSLKRFKEDVKEVLAGYECGIGLDRFGDFQAGDIIEAYVQEKVKAELPGPGARETRG